MTSSYRVIWIVAMIIGAVLVGTVSIFSYLAAISTESSRCVAREWLAGYHGELIDFLAVPVFSAICVGVLAMMPAILKRESTARLLATADSITVFEFLSIRIGYGLFGVIVGFFALFIILGMAVQFCAVRYAEISNYCQLADYGDSALNRLELR